MITLGPFVWVYPLYDTWACGPISRYAPQLASYFHPLHQIPSYPWYPSKLQHTLCWANTSGGWYSTSGVKKFDVFYHCIQMYFISNGCIQQFHTTWMYSTSHSIQNRRDSILPAGVQGHARERYDVGSAIYIWYTKGKNHFLRPLESKILVQPLLWWIPFRRRIQLTISPPPVIASARGLPRCARLPADSQTIHFKLTASTTDTTCPWNCENLCMILLLVWLL